MLENHFTWTYFDGDEFISWTSSLLFALQFAVRKTRNAKNPTVVSAESDVQLCMLNTSSLDTSSFFPASDLITIYGLPSTNKLRHEYHQDDYLFHGMLDVEGISSTVSLSALRGAGLFFLIPGLDDEAHKTDLRRRVCGLRQSMFATLQPISTEEGGLALWIASLFEGGFTMPMFVALLSLQRRCPADRGFLGIIRGFAGTMPKSRK